MQLADLVARPIGIRALRPAQSNRAYEILEKKVPPKSFWRGSGMGIEKLSLKNAKDLRVNPEVQRRPDISSPTCTKHG